MKIKLVVLGLLMGTGGGLGVGAAAQAGCNFHGCSQVPGVECNFHGCPIPPNGGECNFHGCPPPTQQQKTQQRQQGAIYVPVPVPQYPQQTINQRSQANPEDIANCMKSLMYAQRDQYEGLDRTEVSEQTAIQACTGGR